MVALVRVFIAIVCAGLLASCSPVIKREISSSTVFAQNHTGFYLMDPATGKVLIDLNGAKYFTPASNTKIFTFYSSLKLLGDSIPGIYYAEKGDSLIIWGTGDPSLLHQDLPHSEILDFISNDRQIYFSTSNYHDEAFGAGWAWDDYSYAFQPEKSPLPIYGNVVRVEAKPDSAMKTNPPYFDDLLLHGQQKKRTYFKRDLHSNLIQYHLEPDDTFDVKIPFMTKPYLIQELLADTLNQQVKLVDIPMDSFQVKTKYSVASDSLYKRMMVESDNFIAEQLLLLVAGSIRDSLATSIAIDFVRDSLLADAPDPLIWVDGSGLSRYNLFTPRSITYLWQKISDTVSEERLFSLLPSGGVSGTLENWYAADPPYIYGKTGTLSNNHCLSGFIKTKKGKTLIFSFMNSNYRYGSSTIKEEMERILQRVYEKY